MILDISIGLIAFFLAVAFDLLIGEPSMAIHPVVWIGKLISIMRKNARPTRLWGMIVALIVITITVTSGHLLVWLAGELPMVGSVAAIIVYAYLLKSTFAVRCLLQ